MGAIIIKNGLKSLLAPPTGITIGVRKTAFSKGISVKWEWTVGLPVSINWWRRSASWSHAETYGVKKTSTLDKILARIDTTGENLFSPGSNLLTRFINWDAKKHYLCSQIFSLVLQ